MRPRKTTGHSASREQGRGRDVPFKATPVTCFIQVESVHLPKSPLNELNHQKLNLLDDLKVFIVKLAKSV